MARDFNGTTSKIDTTITALSDGDWTMGAWVFPDTTGESATGQIMFLNLAGATKSLFRFNSNNTIIGAQVYSVTNAQTITSTNISTGQWTCLFLTHRGSDNTMRVFFGDLDSIVAETAYVVQTPGVGTFDTTATSCVVGNNSGLTTTWDGRIERAFLVPWELSIGEMEHFRHGSVGVLFDHGTPRVFLPLDSPTNAQCEDLSGNGANGTASNTSVGEGPPIPMLWSPRPRKPVFV